VEGSEVC